MSELVRKPNKINGFLARWYRQTKLYLQEKKYPVESETLFRYIIRGYKCARSSIPQRARDFALASFYKFKPVPVAQSRKERGISH
jgi:hypothetical protein